MATTDRRGVSVSAVDTAIAGSPNPGLAIKAPVLVATTASIALSGLQTIDGTALAAGNRVLVWQQSDPTQNGIYNASTGPWTRAIDANGNDKFASGMAVVAAAGASYIRRRFLLSSADPVTLGASAVVFVVDTLSGANGLSYGGTSVTSLAIANGSTPVFATQTGLAYLTGNYVRASSAANGANFMEGLVVSYGSGALTLQISKIGGGGTHADWNFSVSGAPGAGDLFSANNLSDVASAAAALNNLGGVSYAAAQSLSSGQRSQARTNIGITDILFGKDFGITADGATDDTAAFNAFMAACKAGSHKGELPIGSIRLASKPNDIDFGWDLGGKGIVSSVILRDYNGTGVIGCLQYVDNSSGARLHDLSVQSTAGKTNGSMIRGVSSASFAVSALIFENLWITTGGTDTQAAGIVLDGTAKITNPTGLRDTSLKNVHVFGANGYSVQLQSCVGLSWQGGGVYPAGGTHVASGGIIIGGNASVKSQYVTIDIVTCNGLNLTNCLNLHIASAQIGSISGVSVNNDGTCSLTCVYGPPLGTVSSNWASSGIRRPSAAWATS